MRTPHVADADSSDAAPAPRRRPFHRRVVQLLRRLHMYAGLLMVPWVVLYGITGFLFNHPNAFSDQPAASFGPAALAGSPMASPPSPAEVAARVVGALQKRAKDGATYTLVGPEKARYTREFAFATVTADGQEVSLLFDATGAGGTVRSKPAAKAPKPAEERAPFAVGRGAAGGSAGAKGPRGPGGPAGGRMTDHGAHGDDALKLDAPLHERVAAAAPGVLAATGFPTGEVKVTSVPDLQFRMTDGTREWVVTYNAQAGSVAGKPADAEPVGDGLSARRFLTRLHLAHGYPGEVNAKFAWAVAVDAMAFIMVFWGASGLLMWWQIKATRWTGMAVLVLSAAAAAWVGVGMHEVLTAGGRGG